MCQSTKVEETFGVRIIHSARWAREGDSGTAGGCADLEKAVAKRQQYEILSIIYHEYRSIDVAGNDDAAACCTLQYRTVRPANAARRTISGSNCTCHGCTGGASPARRACAGGTSAPARRGGRATHGCARRGNNDSPALRGCLGGVCCVLFDACFVIVVYRGTLDESDWNARDMCVIIIESGQKCVLYAPVCAEQQCAATSNARDERCRSSALSPHSCICDIIIAYQAVCDV